MKKTILYILGILAIVVVLESCKTKKMAQETVDNNFISGSSSALSVILNPPVNSADEVELSKSVYKQRKYSILQSEEHKFKENTPFIEYIDGGRKERLWFTSSRADDQYEDNLPTNLYQQIYYCEREIGKGVAPGDGWGDIQRLSLAPDNPNPIFEEYYNQFNRATKGGVAIANDKLIISCQHFENGHSTDFNDLWEITRINGDYTNPKPIPELSGDLTWEAQPTLSKDGKHIFFISNREILGQGESVNMVSTNQYNLFYSYNNGDNWETPVVVKEFVGQGIVKTPSLKYDDKILYFSMATIDGDFDIYEVNINLLNDGGYKLDLSTFSKFSQKLIDLFDSSANKEISLNDKFDQQYPFYYNNPVNRIAPRALYWSSNDEQGVLGYDLYACVIPFTINYNVVLVDASETFNDNIIEPIIKISGAKEELIQQETVSTMFYSGLKYGIWGGSTASENGGTYICDMDKSYIFVGYSDIIGNNPNNKFIHNQVLQGPEVSAESCKNVDLKLFYSTSDTIVYDTIFITKAWKKKPYCPGKLKIEVKHKSIAYFQTGYWEVNTTENLIRDLEILHTGYKVKPDNDIYNPVDGIDRLKSDYRAFEWESPLYPVKKDDKLEYSIANARWIELHPNNRYWGDFVGYPTNNEERMKGRKERIEQYVSYAHKVDENLNNLVDTIQYKYIDLLLKHKKHKPRLLIEIFAVSDDREVQRGWYIGDPVKYRGSDYIESTDQFVTEPVYIIPPKVDEKNKVLEQVLNCSIELNEYGNNGSKLGISQNKTDQNTNLSRLRAWFGYKEVYKRLLNSERFKKYLNEGKVALPDNNLSYEDADIIIITRGQREDGDVINPQDPYPTANNPNGTGYFDYDRLRRIDIQTRLLFDNDQDLVTDYCCDPSSE